MIYSFFYSNASDHARRPDFYACRCSALIQAARHSCYVEAVCLRRELYRCANPVILSNADTPKDLLRMTQKCLVPFAIRVSITML